jgi:hypothetical protein
MNQPNNDLQNQMAADSQSSGGQPETAKLSELSNLVLDLQEADREIERISEDLKAAQEKQRELSMNTIPDLFDELKLSTIKMDNGSVVEIKRSFAAHISVENKPYCFKWLRDNNHASIIKHDITVKMKKGEETEAKALIVKLNEMGLTYADKEHVHPMTLKAFVKEQLEKGTALPQEQFGVHPIRQTKIK